METIPAATPFTDVITTEAGLREHYRVPSKLVQAKKIDRIDDTARAFIAAAPFCLLATADADGRCDVSPRGGPPGFVRVLDDNRLALPDLSGNNLLDSITNIVANGHAGLLFVLPGRDETLRAEGAAWITTDPELLTLWDDELRRPKAAIGIEVNSAFVHCAKSFRRGQVWDVASWTRHANAPDCSELLVAHSGLEFGADVVRNALDEGYDAELVAERVPGDR